MALALLAGGMACRLELPGDKNNQGGSSSGGSGGQDEPPTYRGTLYYVLEDPDSPSGTAPGPERADASPISAPMVPPPSGSTLVAHYTFPESEPGRDSSMFGNHGEAFDGVEPVSGKHGTALGLDGSGYLAIPDSPSLRLSGAFTIEAWVRFDRFGGDGEAAWSVLVAGSDQQGPVYGLGLHEQEQRLYSVHRGLERLATASSWSPSPGTGTWYHVATTYDGMTVRQYLNTALVHEEPARGSLAPAEAGVTLGRAAGRADHLVGALDDVMIWKVARTRTQICQDAADPDTTGECRAGVGPGADAAAPGGRDAGADLAPEAGVDARSADPALPEHETAMELRCQGNDCQGSFVIEGEPVRVVGYSDPDSSFQFHLTSCSRGAEVRGRISDSLVEGTIEGEIAVRQTCRKIRARFELRRVPTIMRGTGGSGAGGSGATGGSVSATGGSGGVGGSGGSGGGTAGSGGAIGTGGRGGSPGTGGRGGSAGSGGRGGAGGAGATVSAAFTAAQCNVRGMDEWGGKYFEVVSSGQATAPEGTVLALNRNPAQVPEENEEKCSGWTGMSESGNCARAPGDPATTGFTYIVKPIHVSADDIPYNITLSAMLLKDGRALERVTHSLVCR